MLTLYNTLILPYLTYCNVVWGSAYASKIQPLFMLQKRAIRNICNKDYLHHTAPLFRNLHVLSIYDINQYYVAIFIFNLLCDAVTRIFRNYFVLRRNTHPYPSRAHNQLSIPYYRLRSSQLRIRFIGAKLWNSLPIDVT